jgi:hypothetical protein
VRQAGWLWVLAVTVGGLDDDPVGTWRGVQRPQHGMVVPPEVTGEEKAPARHRHRDRRRPEDVARPGEAQPEPAL